MQKLKADIDIANGRFEKIYLLYGDEPYLLRVYKNRLKNAIIPEAESMNYAYYDNMPDNINSVIDFADTMPFLGDRRLVILDKVQAFKKDVGLADYIPNIPDTTTIIIVEESVDKRSRLYKAISKYGCDMELKKLTLPDIKSFVAGRFGKAGKRITERDCEYFIDCVGDDLNTLVNEADKCIAYSDARQEIDRKTIDAVCSMQIENKIFDMVDAVLSHDGNKAFKIHGDLVKLKENTFGILAVLRRNLNQLLMVSELYEEGCSAVEISSRTHIKDWLVKKLLLKVKNYGSDRLKKAIELSADTEQSIKIGNVSEQLGFEIMLANLLRL